MREDLDLEALRKIPRVGYYFRYPLHNKDFRDLELRGEFRGHYTAKPLYGRLTKDGHVDKSSGFNGDIAALFIPAVAKILEDAKLFLTHTDKEKITLPTGKKNWPAIYDAAENAIREALKEHD